jgi:hypothetical protein
MCNAIGFLTIREFINQCDTTIHLKHIWRPKLLRKFDYSIMDKIIILPITPRELTTANNWRVYFRINAMAQICNNAGNKILPEYFERSQVHLHCSKATVQWPNQSRPHLDTFRIWKKVLIMLSRCSSTGGITDLGEWEHDYSAVIKVSTVLHCNEDALAIWCVDTRQWKIHPHISTNYSFLKFDKPNFEYEDQIDLTKYCPIDITEEANTYNVAGRFIPHITLAPTQRQPIRTTNFHDFVQLSTG